VRKANFALALRHREEIAAYDEIEEAWDFWDGGNASSLRATRWSRMAPPAK